MCPRGFSPSGSQRAASNASGHHRQRLNALDAALLRPDAIDPPPPRNPPSCAQPLPPFAPKVHVPMMPLCGRLSTTTCHILPPPRETPAPEHSSYDTLSPLTSSLAALGIGFSLGTCQTSRWFLPHRLIPSVFSHTRRTFSSVHFFTLFPPDALSPCSSTL